MFKVRTKINSPSSGTHPQNPSRLIRRSLEFVAPDRHRIVGVVLIALFGAALNAAEPLVTKLIFDTLSGSQALPLFIASIAGLLVIEVVRAALSARLGIASWNIRLRVDYRLRGRLLGRLVALPIAYHRRESVGGTINRVNQGITGFLNSFTEVSLNIVPSLVYMALSLAAMMNLDARLCLLVLVFAPIPSLMGTLAAREQAQRERKLLETWSKLYGRLNEVLSGVLTVKGFAQEQAELDRFLAGSREGNQVVHAGIRRDTLNAAARNFVTTLARIAALGYGGYLIMAGEISVGTLVAFLGYIGGLFGPVQGLTNVYQTLRKGVVGLETIYGILDEEDGVADLPNAREAGRLRGRVSFRNVGFTYGPGASAVKEVSLEVWPGETVALVGPSGAGKTTLLNLLQRQYNVTDGAILVDGKDIRSVKLNSLRQQIGAVYQDVHLFNDSVHANIAYGRPEASRAEVEAAAQAANAHEFILTLPEGYDTLLGERGNRLSGGQKQRLAIARALLMDPPILILDEATSALDAESEQLVQQAIRRLSRGRTTFVIAHRLSTVADADRIVVLRDGEIDDVGTHDELMLKGGYYASLVDRQIGGFLRDPVLDSLAA